MVGREDVARLWASDGVVLWSDVRMPGFDDRTLGNQGAPDFHALVLDRPIGRTTRRFSWHFLLVRSHALASRGV